MSRKKNGKGNKFIRFGFMALIIVLVLSAAVNYLPNMTYACEVHDNGYGLQVNHEKGMGIKNHGKLFNINNMGPGEVYTEVITLKNSGPESFQSLISAINTSTKGNLLFDSLDFSIREGSENGKVIFKGKLRDLNNVVLCSLGTKGNKTYYLTLSLPAESGNEYQSRSAGFKFVITASADTASNGGKAFDLKQNNKNNKH